MFKLQTYVLICFVAALTTCEASYVSEMRLPFIVDPIEDKAIVLEDSNYNVEIPCKAFGIPTPTVSWYRNNIILPKEGEFIKVMDNGSLLLKRFYSSYSGYYSCTASNKFGTSMSHRILIRSLSSLKQAQMGDRSVALRLGGFMILPCVGMDKIDFLNYTVVKQWYVNEQPIVPTRRLSIDTAGTLRIARASRADCGEYSCRLAPLMARPNNLIIVLAKAVVSLSSVLKQDEIKPAIMSSRGRTRKAFLTKTGILECFFSGNPTPRITWYDQDKVPLYNGDRNGRVTFRQGGNQLVISNVQRDDEQVYKCIATNSKGTATQNLSLNVTGPPRSRHGRKLMSQIVCKGTNATLRCDAEGARGELMDIPIWYRNGRLLGKGSMSWNSRYSFNDNVTALTIRNVDDMDEANYQCKVSNNEGFLFVDGYLLIPEHQSITLSKKPEDYLYAVSYGDVIDITVRAKGYACSPLIKNWFHQGIMINASTFPVFQTNKEDDTLLFNTSRVKEEDLDQYMGDYECHLSDGNSTAEILLSFTRGGMKAQSGGCDGLARLDATVMWLSTLVLMCLHSLY